MMHTKNFLSFAPNDLVVLFYVILFFFQLIHAPKSTVELGGFVIPKTIQPSVYAFQNVHNKLIHVEWFVQTKIKHGIPTVKCIENVVFVTLMIHAANLPT